MVAANLPHGVIERIVEVLDPEEIWLFGSRARETHGPDSDWDLMAVLPNTAPDRQLDIAAERPCRLALHGVAHAELLAT